MKKYLNEFFDNILYRICKDYFIELITELIPIEILVFILIIFLLINIEKLNVWVMNKINKYRIGCESMRVKCILKDKNFGLTNGKEYDVLRESVSKNKSEFFVVKNDKGKECEYYKSWFDIIKDDKDIKNKTVQLITEDEFQILKFPKITPEKISIDKNNKAININKNKDNYLYKEFNIKEDNLYICVCRPYEYRRDPECTTKRIKGVILNFNPSNNIVIKSDDGLHIIDYRDIRTLHSIK